VVVIDSNPYAQPRELSFTVGTTGVNLTVPAGAFETIVVK